MTIEEAVWKTDKQGRIIDRITGRPLRDARSRRSGKQPFHGKAGSPHPNKAHLQKRIDAWEALRNKAGRKQPGSLQRR